MTISGLYHDSSFLNCLTMELLNSRQFPYVNINTMTRFIKFIKLLSMTNIDKEFEIYFVLEMAAFAEGYVRDARGDAG